MMTRSILFVALACCLLLGVACLTHAQRSSPASPTQKTAQPVADGNASYSPRRLVFSTALLQRLHLPAGFHIGVYATGVTDARVIVLGPGSTVYVSQPDLGQVTALWDRNGDGRAEARHVVASGLGGVHGLTVQGNKLYMAAPTRVSVAEVRSDGTLGSPRAFINNLPTGGRHPNRTLAFGPDGLLYVSVGSSTNDGPESNPEHAAILQFHADGSGRRIFARGLRNTMAFDWHPVTRQMWGMDQGADYRGPNDPPEELNHLMDGQHYGWPWCYGKGQVDEMTAGHPPGMTKAQFCATTEPAVLEYQAHSSPIQLHFYTGGLFPAEYRNDAFLTFHGSWNRSPAVGYKVVRIRFSAHGQPTGFEDFLTGFLTNNGAAQFGRPAGLAVARDGSLLIGDDDNRMIYRVTYEGKH
ncbi:MAG TPA: PQQ-dependent sugar dehydrogenase [Armatimonadota bacterium]